MFTQAFQVTQVTVSPSVPHPHPSDLPAGLGTNHTHPWMGVVLVRKCLSPVLGQEVASLISGSFGGEVTCPAGSVRWRWLWWWQQVPHPRPSQPSRLLSLGQRHVR